MEEIKKPRLFLVLISAAIGIAALLPFNLYFLSFVFLVPFFYFLHEEHRFWKLLLGVIIFRLVFMLGTVYYTLEPLVWLSSLAIFSLLAVIVFISGKLLGGYPWAKVFFIFLGYLVADMLAAKYTLLPTYIMTAGNILGSSPFVGLAKYGGLVSLEICALLVNAFLTWFFLNRGRLLEIKKETSIALAGLVVFFLGAYGLSRYFLMQSSTELASKKNHLRITAVSIKNNFSQTDLQRLVADLGKIQTDLIVLPEELFTKPENEPFSPEEAASIMGDFNAEAGYIIGTFHTLKQGKNYNTAILADNGGEIIDQYDKNKLTILGEYWPFTWRPSIYDSLKNDPTTKNYAIVDPVGAYESGRSKVMRLKLGDVEVTFGALICLEGHHFDMLADRLNKGAKFIVSPNSNRWIAIGSNHFDYLIGNLYNTESIQSGLPMIVSSVNGFAGVFYPDSTRQIVKQDGLEKYSIANQQVSY